jgi:hypothetical protein
VASLGLNGTVIFWRTDTWAEVLRVDKIGDAGRLASLAVHPMLPVMAAPGSSRLAINFWTSTSHGCAARNRLRPPSST